MAKTLIIPACSLLFLHSMPQNIMYPPKNNQSATLSFLILYQQIPSHYIMSPPFGIEANVGILASLSLSM